MKSMDEDDVVDSLNYSNVKEEKNVITKGTKGFLIEAFMTHKCKSCSSNRRL